MRLRATLSPRDDHSTTTKPVERCGSSSGPRSTAPDPDGRGAHRGTLCPSWRQRLSRRLRRRTKEITA